MQYDAAVNLLDSKYREDYSNYNLIRCNQLLHFRGHHYRYGRTQTKQTIGTTQHYHYDAEHRLSEVRIEQTGRSQRYGYVYDALGRRIEKHQIDRDGQLYNRTRFLWDGLRMIQETGSNHPTSLYIYTDQNSYEPLARIDTDGNQEQHIRYFHTDLNGCPEELTDANGKILWECSFQLWGKRIHEIEHEPIEQNLRYQGQYLDRETGLHYNTFRYYDPDIGRFTQPDPIGLLGGLNLYQYAPNGFTWIDPLGLSCSFDSKSNRWRNNETGRFNKRPTDPSELVHNGQIKYNDVTKWANQGGISNQWMSSSQFPSGGFKYQTNSNGITYSVHGHGTNPNAVARYPSSNAAKGPTASITTRPTGGAHSAQTNTLSNGTKVNSRGRDDVQMNQSHIPLINSPF
ncbi:hypothetical protein B6D03_13490 [Gilliamella apicola]|nr:hypothetical protein B6D03_13490 [Gilliamella apicola]